MEKKDLIILLDKVLIPLKFKRKGNYWVNNHGEIIKMVHLQKSSYSNLFYLNYGFILKSIPLGRNVMHIDHGLGSIDEKENERIKALLDLENKIGDTERESALAELFRNDLVEKLQAKNSEDDLLNDLKKRPHLNGIPVVVKKYFGLPIE